MIRISGYQLRDSIQTPLDDEVEIVCDFATSKDKSLFVRKVTDVAGSLYLDSPRGQSTTGELVKKDRNPAIASLAVSEFKALDTFGLIRNVSGRWVQEVEQLWQLRRFQQGHVLCRKGAASTRLYFVLKGQITTGQWTKSAGEFVPEAEFLATLAKRFKVLHDRVLLPSSTQHNWTCVTTLEVLEVTLDALMALVARSPPLYHNLYNIATAHTSIHGKRYTFSLHPDLERSWSIHGENTLQAKFAGRLPTDTGGLQKLDNLSFDQLTEKQRQRLKNAGDA